MRLQPVQLLDDHFGHANPSIHSPPRGLSRRALIAAALGGGAALGFAASLPGTRRPSTVALSLGASGSFDRLGELPPEDLLVFHQGLVFAAAAAPLDDPEVDRMVLRLLDVVLASEAGGRSRAASLRSDAALSLVTLARLRGGPAPLIAALPRLEVIR